MDDAFLQAIAAAPDDEVTHLVYADWLDEHGHGHPCGRFLRVRLTLLRLGPDHPDRPPHEVELSRLRRDISPDWLAVVEPERAHLHRGVVGRPSCHCCQRDERNRWREPRFHLEPQDTECDPWRRLLDLIEEAAARGPSEFAPMRGWSEEDRARIVTLPPTIAKLKAVRALSLYGSSLVRVPPEIGEMTNLEEFTPYTSYRLHWFPFEITRCARLRESTVSTRALYGNHKYRPPFPRLGPGERAGPQGEPTTRPCSVCRQPFADEGRHRVWVSLRVVNDVLPLLVNACSHGCVERLPAPPDGYVPHPHRGGKDLEQPAPLY